MIQLLKETNHILAGHKQIEMNNAKIIKEVIQKILNQKVDLVEIAIVLDLLAYLNVKTQIKTVIVQMILLEENGIVNMKKININVDLIWFIISLFIMALMLK